MALTQTHSIYTVGFTKKNAETFFELLNQHDVKRLLDVRINNTSQLAAFTKQDDLKYFLQELCDIEYLHAPQLAPTKDLLKRYRNGDMDWQQYERDFLTLLAERQVENDFPPRFFSLPTVLLCSEVTAEHCHRRLVVEYLQRAWGTNQLDVVHL